MTSDIIIYTNEAKYEGGKEHHSKIMFNIWNKTIGIWAITARHGTGLEPNLAGLKARSEDKNKSQSYNLCRSFFLHLNLAFE